MPSGAFGLLNKMKTPVIVIAKLPVQSDVKVLKFSKQMTKGKGVYPDRGDP